MKFAQRLQNIAPFHVMDLLAKAKNMQSQGRDVIHLEVGEPDFESPPMMLDGGKQALNQGLTHYTAATGLPELKQAIAKYYQDQFAQTVDPHRIVITPGASGALQLVTSMLADAGENMLLADPGYPCNRHFLRLLGAEGKLVPVSAQNDYQLTASTIDQYWDENTLGALVASPSNPTGTCLNAIQLEQLHNAIKARSGLLIVDEIYQGISYDTESVTAVSLGDDTFVINSFSKYFGMTGWRLGWIVAPLWAVPSLDKLAQNIFLAAPTVAQYAALKAFDKQNISVLKERTQEFKARRDYLLPALQALGFKVHTKPQGAFYIYCDISQFSDDSMAFCQALLEQEAVAVTPGKDFGENQAHIHVRFAYTAAVPRLKEAIRRIKRFLSNDTASAQNVQSSSDTQEHLSSEDKT